ncbi:hypothetical protein HDU91_005349 [Kappamyces sp. JEL0680]|nr:hypothetical protein HDU91_005349 [Kappamyces sp. JEL0680]
MANLVSTIALGLLLVGRRAEINRVFRAMAALNEGLAYSLLGHVLLSWCHLLFLDPLFKYPLGSYNPAHIDPSVFFTTMFLLLLSPSYALKRAALDQDTLVFPSIHGRFLPRLKSVLVSSLYKGLVQSVLFTAAFSVFYTSLGSIWLLTPRTVPQKFSFFTVFNVFLQIRTVLLGSKILAMAELGHGIFNLVFTMNTQRMPFPAVCEKIRTKQVGYSKYLAFLAFHTSTFCDPAFSLEIFNDVDSTETSWNRARNICLDELNGLVLALKEYSKNTTTKKDALKSLDGVKRPPPLASSAPGSILAPTKKSFVQNATKTAIKLFTENEADEQSRGPASLPFLAPAAEVSASIVPDVLLPSRPAGGRDGSKLQSTQPSAVREKDTIPGSKEFLTVLSTTLARLPYGATLVDETIKSECNMIFKHAKLVVWSCQILTKFVVTSTAFDKYAQVYGQVPLILQGFLSLHSALEEYIKAKHASNKPLSAPLLHVDRVAPILRPFASKDSVSQILNPAIQLKALVESSIFQILSIYHDHLHRFKFEEEWQEKMQRFVDFV